MAPTGSDVVAETTVCSRTATGGGTETVPPPADTVVTAGTAVTACVWCKAEAAGVILQASESSTSLKVPPSRRNCQPWPRTVRPTTVALRAPFWDRVWYRTDCPGTKFVMPAADTVPQLLLTAEDPRGAVARAPASGRALRTEESADRAATGGTYEATVGGCTGGCAAAVSVSVPGSLDVAAETASGQLLHCATTSAMGKRLLALVSKSCTQSFPNKGPAWETASFKASSSTGLLKCIGTSDLPIRSATKRPVTISVMRRPRAQQSSPGDCGRPFAASGDM
mmetsp:Transcript_5282/g.12399  ORF Transcript_5282/g.12399 Transcript_5282/m.12399 type:complete len:281 (+) Transcript_5282:497-1339(+)